MIKIPAGLPPRQAFGYAFIPLLYLLRELCGHPVQPEEIKDLHSLAKVMLRRQDASKSEGKTLCREMAVRIHKKIPLVYGTSPALASVAVRWKNQFQENAKSLAFNNTIPEMNHNEIVGWEMSSDIWKKSIVIFIEKEEIHPRMKARINLTKNIIRNRGADVIEVHARGNTDLEHIISLVYLGDWTSYYLALLYEKDPMAILNIDYLKAELKKVTG